MRRRFLTLSVISPSSIDASRKAHSCLDGHNPPSIISSAAITIGLGHYMAEARVERRLAAILAADVVGYSRLMGADEAGTLAALKRHRETIFDPSPPTTAAS